MNRIEEILTERAKVYNQMVALNDKAESEKRSLNADEKVTYDKLVADFAGFKERADRMTELENNERAMNASRTGRIVDNVQTAVESGTVDSKAYRSALTHYFRTGNDVQLRAIGTGAASGALLPTDVVTDVMNALNRGSQMRKAGATVYTSSTNSNIPISTAVTGTFETETTSFASAEPTYSAFSAKAWKVTAKSLLSNEMLADAGFDVAAHITNRLVDGMSQTADNQFMIGAGSGSSVPTGIISGATAFTASVLTAPGAVDVFNWYYAIPAQYRASLKFGWLMNDILIGAISSLGNVVGGGSDVTVKVPFSPALTPGAQDTLFGKPVYSSAAITNAFAANALMGFGGDVSYYAIVDRIQNNFGITRLNELYAETGQTMFLGSFRTDGKFTVADAGRTYKCSAE